MSDEKRETKPAPETPSTEPENTREQARRERNVPTADEDNPLICRGID